MSNTYSADQLAMAIMHALNCYGYNLISYEILTPVEYSKHILYRLEYIDSIRDSNMVYTSVSFKRTKGRGIVKDIRVRVCGHAHGGRLCPVNPRKKKLFGDIIYHLASMQLHTADHASQIQQLTDQLGYDLQDFFSPDYSGINSVLLRALPIGEK